MGIAMARHIPMDVGWAVQVFTSSSKFTHVTGPDTLNAELESMWEHYLTPAEKIAITTSYVAERLAR